MLALFVAIPAMFWYGTWFGTRMDDTALLENLRADARPRDVQHALLEYTRRLEEGRPGTDRFAAAVLAASAREDEGVRIACAWAMQYDPGRPEFVQRLREMLLDASPLVRRNAATSLATSGDPAGLPVLRGMLMSHAVASTATGTVDDVAPVGRIVREHEPVASLRTGPDGSQIVDVRSPLPGRIVSRQVEPGDPVETGAGVVVVGPDPAHVANAVAALARVGERQDVESLRLVASPRSDFPEDVRRMAAEAAAAVEARLAE